MVGIGCAGHGNLDHTTNTEGDGALETYVSNGSISRPAGILGKAYPVDILEIQKVHTVRTTGEETA